MSERRSIAINGEYKRQQSENTHVLEDSSGLIATAIAVKGNHAAKAMLLALGQIVLRVRWQPWICDAMHLFVTLEKKRDSGGVAVNLKKKER